jgi:hypothetical protein
MRDRHRAPRLGLLDGTLASHPGFGLCEVACGESEQSLGVFQKRNSFFLGTGRSATSWSSQDGNREGGGLGL